MAQSTLACGAIPNVMTMRQVLARPLPRESLIASLRDTARWDAIVVGGGATGLGIALDAAARGLRVALIEQRDFASGTSSRSTKLIHGGVRYLAQGNIALVREALTEREVLSRIAPALVRPLEFVVPCYRPAERAFLRAGLGIYDALAGSTSMGPTRLLSRAEAAVQLPGVSERGLRGGVSYWDAQFDDAALAIALMQTACALGATAVNYVACEEIVCRDGRIDRLLARDVETGERFELPTACVFNATGVWVDALRGKAVPGCIPMVTVSQGSHVVLDHRFMPADAAMLIPRTTDGRVMFLVPWYGALILGTTDVPRSDAPLDPLPDPDEVAFLLRTVGDYLAVRPGPDDVRTAFCGLRPLFSASGIRGTARISREHAVLIEGGNLVSVVGGKWTTYRRMAEDAVDAAVGAGLLPPCPDSETRTLQLVPPQFPARSAQDFSDNLSDARFLDWAYRFAQARTEEDVRARRTRLDFLVSASATAATSSGPR